MSKWHPLHPDRLVLYGIIFTSLNALVKLYWDWYLRRPKQEIIKKKPFNFQMFDTRQIGMFVNNVRVPGQPYKIDGDCYISAYSSLFDVVNKKILQCIHRKKTAFSSSSGKHWLVPSKHSFVFDSFGRRETLPARHDSNIF